ncbi:MAG: helix-turn-helix domain-containing protein [Bacteroidota bacterium]
MITFEEMGVQTINIQSELFSQVKLKLNPGLSLVEEIAELLSVSTDSAYRRLRGETILTLDEIKKICNHYHISADGLLHIKTGSVVFNKRWHENGQFSYAEFLLSMDNDLKALSQQTNPRIIFFAKDFPVFYNFVFPEIAAFKSFFWQKTALQSEELKNAKFDVSEMDEKYISVGYTILGNYNKIPSYELWNDEVMNSFISQVLFYHESGYMRSASVAKLLLDKLSQLIHHFQLQAETATKFLPGKSGVKENSFQLYYNEVLIGDNTLCASSDEHRMVILTQNVVNTLSTTDREFCDETFTMLNGVIQRSSLISSAAEKERNKFFKRLQDKVDMARARV